MVLDLRNCTYFGILEGPEDCEALITRTEDKCLAGYLMKEKK